MNGVNQGLNGQATNRVDGALGEAEEVDIDRTSVVKYLYMAKVNSN